MTEFLGQNDIIRQNDVIFNFKYYFNGLATDYPMGLLFIIRFKSGFKSVEFSKVANFRENPSKL